MASLRLAISLVLAALMLAAVPNASAIVGGELDTAHPQVVFVGQVIITPNGPRNATACSGTLLAPRVVVTAAHCGLLPPGFEGLPQFFVVRTGENFRRPTGQQIGLYAPHPGFTFGGHGLPRFTDNDVAVIQLVTGALPGPYAELPAQGVVDEISTGSRLEVVGYGISKLKGTEPLGDPVNWDGFRRADEAKLLGDGSIGDTFLKHKSGTCEGDSGGPVLLGNVVLAVNSFGPSPCKSVAYASRLDTPSTLEFLGRYLGLR